MVQYEIYVTNEYIGDIVRGLSQILAFPFCDSDIQNVLHKRNKQGIENLIMIHKDGGFVCIDCNDRDYVYPFIVRCMECKAKAVNEFLLQWDRVIREEYGQELTDEIKDVYGMRHTLLAQVENMYHCCIE